MAEAPTYFDPLTAKLVQFVELWDRHRHILNPVPPQPGEAEFVARLTKPDDVQHSAAALA